jgi:hypothetical protein
MILPDKTIQLENSLMGMGARLLPYLIQPQSVSSLWEKSRSIPEINSFEKFTLTLVFLFSLNLVNFEGGVITQHRND